MVLGLAALLAPLLGVVTFFLGRYGLRSGHRGFTLALVACAVTVEGLAVWAGVVQSRYVVPASLSEQQAPGTYVRLGQDARDEVVLLPNGAFVRTASYRGVTQRQSGRWSIERRPSPPDGIEFSELVPPCLRSTAVEGSMFHLGEPDQTICSIGDSYSGSVCLAGGRLALCLGDDGFEFFREPSAH